MADNRVAITGLGVLSAAGIGSDELLFALGDNRSCVGPVQQFDASQFPCSIAAEVADFSARKFVPKSYRKSVKVMARDIEIAVAAADLAFRDAELTTRAEAETDDQLTVPAARMGCNIGAGLICTDLDELGSAVNTAVSDGEFDFKKWGQEGLLKYLPNMLSCHVTIIHGLEGPSNCITCGDASGHLAIGESGRHIARGVCDVAIAGGAESKVNPMGMLRLALLKRLVEGRNDTPQTAVRPFDVQAGGTVAGEGGGLLILENYEHARRRGVRIYAELTGFGAACDPNGINVTAESAGGLDLAIRRAMDRAGIAPEQVGAIVTHGSGVPGEDAREALAWTNALGDRVGEVPAVSATGAIGNLAAGSGGLQAALACLIAHRGEVPTTVNFTAPREGCALSLSGQRRQMQGEYVIAGCFGVGGQSAASVFKRVTD